MKLQINAFPTVNQSRRDHHRAYYDQELRAVVERKDRELLGHFEYRF
jgi:hypothetical protein